MTTIAIQQKSENATWTPSVQSSNDAQPRDLPEVDIAIVTEGTYPHLKGGVSSVIHQVIGENPDLRFGVIHITWDKSYPLRNIFPLPKQLAWVHHVYLAPNHQEGPRGLTWLSSSQRRQIADEVLNAIDSLQKGHYDDVLSVYFRYFNPDTRHQDFWKVFDTPEFISALYQKFSAPDLPFAQWLWMMMDFFSLSHAMLDRRYPRARLYHSHSSGYAGLVAALAAAQNERPFVLTEHSLYIKEMLSRFSPVKESTSDPFSRISRIHSIRDEAWCRWFELMGRFTYHQCRAATYLFHGNARAAQALGCDRRKVQIIPNGIDLSVFEETRRRQENRHQQRKQASGFAWSLGFLGRIVPIKGILDLIDAMVLLRKQLKVPFHLDLFGPVDENPEYFRACASKVTALDLSNHVRFAGTRDPATVLADTDIILLSSHSEALPMAVLEAMGASVPVIATDVGCVRQVLTMPIRSASRVIGEAGSLVKPRDAHSMADAITALLRQPKLYNQYRINGPERVRTTYQASANLKHYRTLYNRLMQ